MQTSIAYNEDQVKYDGVREDTKKGFKLWIDIVNPIASEISDIGKTFDLDRSSLEAIENKSKKPQVRVLDNHKFTIILDIKYKTFEDLVTESIYLFHGTNWLITVHSDKIDLLTNVRLLFEQKNKKIMAASIDALYYNILTEIISRYEQLLTSVELTISDLDRIHYKKERQRKFLNN